MAAKEVLNLEVKSNIKQVSKDTEILQAKLENTNLETKELVNNFGAFGITVGSIKQKFSDVSKIMLNGLKNIGLQARIAAKGFQLMFGGEMKTGARVLFNVIKSGIAATGIGALVIAFAALVQSFRSSEEGASKFRQITAQLGVVVGNVSDIVTNLGTAIYRLFTEGLGGFKESLAEAVEGVKNFGEETKKEMEMANQLEKDRLALQVAERKHTVQKAKAERDMLELRLKSRDIEKFSNKERLEFLRGANEIAEDQLAKDLEIVKEKLRTHRIEMGFSKNKEEVKNKEAALEAEIFRTEKANFQSRRMMKSEEQTLAIQISNEQTKAANKLKKEQEAELARIKELEEVEIERVNKLTTDAAKLLDDFHTSQLDQQTQETNAIYDKYFAIIEGKKQLGMDTAELEDAQRGEIAEINAKWDAVDTANREKETDEKIALDRAVWNAKMEQTTRGFQLIGEIAGKGSKVAKAAAIAQATTAGVQSVMNAFNSANANVGLTAATAGAYPFVQAALAAGFAAVNIKKIVSGEGPSGVTPPPPTIDTIAPAPEMMSGKFELGGGIKPEPFQAYVVSDDITNNQDKLAAIRRRATL